ncbi:MAG: pilus assembly protein [Devosia sp.]|uniref:TadE/TadG family type IV pilus assembly protein n=1 Tax=Devosia sp. TaxID=1871048 RepID=UPI0024C555C7|nr:TadE/TadG family type IV pilus assembly protein [Devosia sp.]UYN99334.1 MAG: pilus assembly protein [Devosia sp.]
MGKHTNRRKTGLFGRAGALARDERGATAVEFGLLALPFFTLVAAILQTSVVFLAGQVLESAVYDASRIIRTGEVRDMGNSLATFRSQVCGRLFGMFPDCSAMHIRVTEVNNFASAGVASPIDADCEGECAWNVDEAWTSGAGKSVMLVQVYYKYPIVLQFGALGVGNLPDGSRLLGTATVFQNEPFT